MTGLSHFERHRIKQLAEWEPRTTAPAVLKALDLPQSVRGEVRSLLTQENRKRSIT